MPTGVRRAAVLLKARERRSSRLNLPRPFQTSAVESQGRSGSPLTYVKGAAMGSSPEEENVNVLGSNRDIVEVIGGYFGDNEFFFFALVSKTWRSAWGKRPATTRAVLAHTSAAQLRISFECGLKISQKVSFFFPFFLIPSCRSRFISGIFYFICLDP